MAGRKRKLTAEEKQEHEQYLELVKSRMPRSRTVLRCFLAFITGGAICCLGQLLGDVSELLWGLDESARGSFVSVVLIIAASFLTGIGVYDKIGKFAGAGSVVPITGFSNSITAPAMEHRPEGIVTGVCAQMFSIAGPVLVFGITSSVIVGIIAWIITLL
ncbi:MAG: stage V sporulation protein AC [Clostridia bacterium]|jgi:stage V sporulation protein AC|nr:stage V sporulation protein AC [Clostridia bacterium]